MPNFAGGVPVIPFAANRTRLTSTIITSTTRNATALGARLTIYVDTANSFANISVRCVFDSYSLKVFDSIASDEAEAAADYSNLDGEACTRRQKPLNRASIS